MNVESRLEAIANPGCVLGENPLWHPDEQALYWEDIETGRLFRYDRRTNAHEVIYEGETVGGFTFQADGSLLLFGVNRILRRRPDGALDVVRDGVDERMERFNDVIADPRGRVYAGTIGRDNDSGGLYRVETDGRIDCLWYGTGCSNGMGFSPDERTFYWTCTTSGRIFAFDYHAETGRLSKRRVLVEAPASEGYIDGMTVDTAGSVWSARWDGFAVYRYTPEGTLLGKIAVPVGKASSVTFGGPGLDELYITTAGGRVDASTADGTLYRLRTAAQGMPPNYSRIHIAG